ncbi:hypothetical protein B7494_g2558 [Chlorociboria aeruginascens]|nr:hypothetical protein B7494_g2558 [Chlorociboria aeruginascens]
MLPLIEDSVLQSNPKFAALHSTLTKNILNPSGSTKNDPAQKERDAITEKLKTARIQLAKQHLLSTSLTTMDLTPSIPSSKSKSAANTRSLPADLLEIILLLSTQLPNRQSPSTIALLENTSQYALLDTYMPQISALISQHLHSLALALCRILFPSTNPSFMHRQIPKLGPHINTLQTSILSIRNSLSQSRASLVSTSITLLSSYQEAIVLVIRTLEQNKHGALARNAKATGEFLALKAKEMEAEARERKGRVEKMVYSEEVKGALANYRDVLRDGRERLNERRKGAERTLWGYGVGRPEGEKEKVMNEIARVYGELNREVGDVRRDVEKLRGR